MKPYVSILMVLMMIFTSACAASAEEPATTSETAAVTEETPAATEETPTVAEETPAAAEETPATADGPNRINYLVLVSKENAIPDDWDANLNLVTTTDVEGNEVKLEAEALDQFNKLHEALMEQNVDLEITDAYVSVEVQQRIMDGFIHEWGEEYAKEVLDAPGYSEFHTGLAFDICFVKKGQIQSDKDYMYEDCKKQFRKLYEILADYGFIVRYPEGKEDITGHGFEPWHLRYVGSPEIAKEITEQGLTLEEYLAK